MRAAVAVFFRFKGGVYLEPDDLEASGELCCFLCFDLAVLDVIILSQFDNGWKLSEFARHLPQAQKRNSYPYVDELYRSEERLNLSLRFFAALAIFLACLGLFGLALFSIGQRTKEVGIRKVLGAGTVDIVTLLSKDFLRWVGAATIVAWPLSYYAVNKWLQSFAYRTSFELWIFAVAAASVLGISVLTVAYQAVKAAVTNPVDSLRYE